MNVIFAETLRKLREEKGLTQKQLGKQMFVNHSTIARWESGSRLPDASMILRLARILGADASSLFRLVSRGEDIPNVLLVDDSRVILTENLLVVEQAMPDAAITGFVWPGEAVEFAKMNRISLAFLDIELGSSNGFDLCHKLLEINPLTNIVFLTAYPDYALKAWDTRACGFLLKPPTVEDVRDQLKRLRYPIQIGGEDK